MVALTLSLIISFSVFAQAEAPACTMPDINTVIIAMLADISTLQTAALDDDIPAALAVLAVLDERVHSLQSVCAEQPRAQTSTNAGLTFSGTGSRVTEPFEIPAGTYRVMGEFVRENAGSFVSVTLIRLSGRCGLAVASSTYLFASSGEPEEALVQSNSCEALLQINGNMRQWSLTFELIR